MTHELSTARTADRESHALWVRIAHTMLGASVVTLAVSGFVILMVHPRLYWGEVGNDLTPALLELPISRNYQHGGFTSPTPIAPGRPSAVTANRTFEIFNQNDWGRSLHFLAAWALVVPGLVYVILGIARRHFRAHVWPTGRDLALQTLKRDVAAHLRPGWTPPAPGQHYGPLQKCAYSAVIFVMAPVAVASGLTMSPAVTAAVPVLLDLFGGFQSARTIHFVAFVLLSLFAIGHVTMVIRAGFARHVRAITTGD